jgi:hypothetical protein
MLGDGSTIELTCSHVNTIVSDGVTPRPRPEETCFPGIAKLLQVNRGAHGACVSDVISIRLAGKQRPPKRNLAQGESLLGRLSPDRTDLLPVVSIRDPERGRNPSRSE